MKTSPTSSPSKNQKKKSTSLPSSTVEYLKNWMMSPEHIAHPYPTEKEKSQIMADTGIELKQMTNWFVNNRKRYWKPRVEARLKQQTQVHNAAALAEISSHPTNGETNGVCFNLAVFPSQVEQNVLPQNVSNTFQNKTKNVDNTEPKPDGTVNSTSPQMSFDPPYYQGFVNASGQHFISPYPQQHEDFTEPNVQVVSTGSASTFSDCDSSSSSNDNTQESVLMYPSNSFQSGTNKNSPNDRTFLIGQAIAQSLNTGSDKTISELINARRSTEATNKSKLNQTSGPRLAKRVRSVSDFETHSYSNSSSIIIRPRSLTFNNDNNRQSQTKRRFVDCKRSDGWQSACQNASHGYDSALPTLEEASLLFGFANNEQSTKIM